MTKPSLVAPRCLVFLFLLAGLGNAQAQMPLQLFNGTSLLGWTPHGSWSPAGGTLTTTGAQPRSLMTAVPFSDFSLTFEYNESAPMGTKLRVWAPHEDHGGVYVDLDGSGQSAGLGGVEGSPGANAGSFSGPGWHTVQVDASSGQLSVTVDGHSGGRLSGSAPRAGYLSFEASGNGTLQIRNVRLTPQHLNSAYNGTDLGNWKSVNETPKSKGGLGHDVEKTLSFGIAGGSAKQHVAKWTVKDGAMHGEDGPGGLEYATQFEDGIIELTASTKGQPKPDHFTALGLREPPGQLDGGYPVGVGAFTGTIKGLAQHPYGKQETRVEQTIVIAGRTTEIWTNGMITTVNTDPRPESARVAQGAKDASGALTFVLPGDGVQLDVQKIAFTALPKPYGASTPAPQPIASTTSSPQPAGGTPPQPTAPPPSPTETAMLRQQMSTQQQADQDRQTKQRVAGLMAQALASTDPARQMDLYNQVVQLDPSNAPAVQGYKDAQSKVQSAQAQQQQQIATQVYAQHDALTKDQQVNQSLVKAQGAFLAGHMAEASGALGVAERLSPGNPMVRDLRSRINASNTLRSRLLLLGSGAGILTLITLVTLWFRRRRQSRFPMFEITDGLDSGEQFPLDKDIVRIGAITQDGAQKNDIVLRDVERLISRFHCEITRKDGLLYVTDLNSSNGTTLNGTRLQPGKPELLRRGSRINLANVSELRLGFSRHSKAK